MGFSKSVFAKRLNKANLFVLAFVASIISCGLATVAFSSSVSAAEVVDNYSLYTAPDGVRWEWEVVSDSENTNEPQKLNLMFYDKPENLTTVTVPSYNDMTTITGVTPASDTYYVRNANQESQDTRFTNPDPARRTANQADVTVLDMTNTSKVQIMGVKPIINPETEVELIFGENMVIGDNFSFSRQVRFQTCDVSRMRREGVWMGYDDNGQSIYQYAYRGCHGSDIVIDNPQDYVSGYNQLSLIEQINYEYSLADFGYTEFYDYYPEDLYDVNTLYAMYFSTDIVFESGLLEGAFEGYKIKLSGFENIKYLGWHAFANTILNESSRNVTIYANQFAGEGVFQGSNVTGVSFEGTASFPAMFKDCGDLVSVDFGNLETISYNTFEDDHFESLDFSNTSVKEILGQAFKNVGLTSINLNGVEKLGYEAFADNNLTELFMPKSINDINTARIFAGNPNLTKLTIAYDTLTTGTKYPLHDVIGETNGDSQHPNTVAHNISELVVLAPYGDGEALSPTHTTYEDWYGTSLLSTSYYDPLWAHDNDEQYGKANSYKNVLAPGYFYGFSNLSSVTIGEGYEFIGASAFYNYGHGVYRAAGNYHFYWVVSDSKSYGIYDRTYSVSLPNTLKGIGSNAFSVHIEHEFNINFPESLEYIGRKAFKNCAFMKNDLDLPNLRYIGTQAFNVAGVHDVYLHDKIEFVGYSPFQGAWNLHDVTFDFDVFGIGNMFNGGTEDVMGNGTLGAAMFGNPVVTWSGVVREYYDEGRYTDSGMWGKEVNKVGTITFTEKATTEINGNYSDFAPFFIVAADKVDISKTPWKILPQKSFLGATIDEILLPENLEFIGPYAFQSIFLKEELVLPDTIKVISNDAFNNYDYWNSTCNKHYDLRNDCRADRDRAVKITKLPESLEFVGGAAFYADYKMEADLGSPHLKAVGSSAFMRTSIRDIVLHDEVTTIFKGAFNLVGTIRNITLDCNFFNALYNSYSYPYGETYGYGFNPAGQYGTASLGSSNFFMVFGMDPQTSYYDGAEGMEVIDLWDWKWTYRVGNIVMTEKVLQPTYGRDNSWFSFVAAKDVDVSRTTWKMLVPNFFLNVSADNVYLPESLEQIGNYAFQYADIKNELILPDNIKKIGDGVFNNPDFVNKVTWSSPYTITEEDYKRDRSIKITKLPDSLEEVGVAAFYGNYKLETDLDLPNLRIIKNSAFARTSLKNVTLHDSIEEAVGGGAFACIPSLEDITIDFDYYALNNLYRYPDYHDFYSVFNLTPYTTYPGAGVYWGQEYGYDVDYKKIVFTEKAVTEPQSEGHYTFARLTIGELDLSATGWKNFGFDYFFQNTKIDKLLLPEGLETVTAGAFYGAEVAEPITMPESIMVVEPNAFELSKITIANGFAEGLTTIGASAFYGAQVSGDLVIPSTVESIGWSAFNAGDTDTNYNTVTIKPALNYDSTDSQAIFQLFWNAKMDKLIIGSPMLPVLGTIGDDPVLPHEVQYEAVTSEGAETITVVPTLRTDGEPEFHGMTMREVEITALPEITANAFEECGNLEKVTFSSDANLSRINKYAFNNATKLKQVIFGEANNNKDINLHEYAFNNTAIESLGITDDSGMNLAAANFRTADEHVFSNMPKLAKVSIPSNFNVDESLANAEKNTNGSYITSFTFSDDPELSEVTIDYQVSEIRDGAFLNDEKLSKLFVWGNAEIQESDDLIRDFNNTTIPKGTTIFAYSDAPAEAYANAESRNDYDGKFYALDEVLYLTSNKSKVLLEQDEEGNNIGFDKTGLKLYGLRRDGVILESDWQNYNTAFKRTETPEGTNISFEEGRGALGPDDAAIAATVFDAPKPFNTISLANQNFANVDYEFVAIASNNNPLIVVHYPDGYTGNIRNTTLVSTTVQEITEDITDPEPEEELEVPDTGSYGALIGAATSSVSIAAVVVLGGIFITKRRRN
ncbi:leucine-rich repeat protein [Candidatus Saccharibacteria bacterium]|nr:leucine-rich repeat protein [Candidatus Saccharibacteria bacterium]